MSLSHNPKTVTDGLVLALDAANTRSFNNTSTTWKDLTTNANDVTLINGPMYSSTVLGSITFDGVDDYTDFYAPGLETTATIEMWLNATSLGGMFMGWGRYDIYTAGGNLGYNTASSNVYGISSATVSSLGLVGNWRHYVFEMRSDVSFTNNKIYINGQEQVLSAVLPGSGEQVSARNFNNGFGRISGWRNDNGYRLAMNLAVFKVYNRALTPTEIRENFNALRGRYSL